MHNEFRRSFNRTRAIIVAIWVVSLIIGIVFAVAIVTILIYIGNNPEVIGEFFGKIVQGFKLVQ